MTDFNRYSNTVGQVGRIWFEKEGILCELITTYEASRELDYSERHIRRMCDEGTLIAIKLSGFWFIERPSLEFVRERLEEIPF